MQLTQASALGVRALIRDEEWIIRNADQCNLGGWQLSCIGVSETVRTPPGGPAQRTIYYIDPSLRSTAKPTTAWLGRTLPRKR
ncbi:hypothetical protein D3C71_564130 [compost metagenome]